MGLGFWGLGFGLLVLRLWDSVLCFRMIWVIGCGIHKAQGAGQRV